MTLHWRQALTSMAVSFAAALIVGMVVHGALDRDGLAFAAAVGFAVGASRLIELRR